MVRIKICGITNLDDALICAKAGADALGFVFHRKSLRFISVEEAYQIIKELPIFINKVAVLTEYDVSFMERLADIGIDTFQIYFDVDLKVRSTFPNIKFIRAVRLKNSKVEDIDPLLYDAVLLDAYVPGLLGGTGKTVNWEVAANLVKKLPCPVVLAGGLSPENVKQAIKTVHPYAVDVSSGVEKEPGRKDERKICDFINAVHLAF